MAKILLNGFDFLFGCWHRNLSRPFTLSGWTYEVCLTCGKKLAYDRADIGCIVAQRKNLSHQRELLHSNNAKYSRGFALIKGHGGHALTLFAAPTSFLSFSAAVLPID
jgi:hypothetical protein